MPGAFTSGTNHFTNAATPAGRWPHIHFEIHPDVGAATSSGPVLRTSEMALPQDTSAAVYGTAGYEQSVSLLTGESLATDNAFRDGYELQTPTLSGSVGRGLTATLDLRI